MSAIPSSVAWLNSKYSRAKGEITRTTARIKTVEGRLEFHRRSVRRREKQLTDLRAELVRMTSEAKQLAPALKLHAHAPRPETVNEIRPHRNPRFFKRGGMTTAIFRELRRSPDGVLTIDELQARLTQPLDLDAQDIPRFRKRLQIRLYILHREGKVRSPDPKGADGKRWMLSDDWVPSKPSLSSGQAKKYPQHHSRGSIQPARWLIQTQLEIAALQSGDAVDWTGSLASKLEQDMASIYEVWKQHPLYFEVDLGKGLSPRARAYRAKVCAGVALILARSECGMTATALQAAIPHPSDNKRRASRRAVEAALRQFMHEGRVEHRLNEEEGLIEWR